MIKLRKVISSPKGANVWLEVQVDGLGWYVIIRVLLDNVGDEVAKSGRRQSKQRMSLTTL